MKLDREFHIFLREHDGFCSHCGKKIKDNETVFVGYDSNDQYAAVCKECENTIKTLIEKVAHREKNYKVPEPATCLWKFMDLGKFLSLIQRNELYFRRADCFDDPYEGARGMKKNETIWDDYYRNWLIKAVKSTKQFTGKDVPDEKAQQDSIRLLNDLKKSGEIDRSRSFICCWHANEFESEAMWNLYTSDTKQGIAIQTSYESLYLALDRDPGIATGFVNYIDFSKDFSSFYDTLFFKRYSFAHEKEVRSVIYRHMDIKDLPTGIYIPINLDRLIENIYVSPTSQPWFYEVVKNIVDKYGLKKNVLQSTLNEEPFY